MRKIISREERNKKTKRNQLVIGVVLIGVLVFGTLGYAFGGREDENSDKIEYKGTEFIKDNEYWNFNIQGYDFVTKYNPKETEDISFFSYISISNYANQPLYFVSEFNEPNFEISRNLNSFVLRMQEVCLSDCEKDLPVKNCSVDNIIVIEELESKGEAIDETENIYQEENCVFIRASFENQTRYVDAFLFKILGL